MTVGVSCGCVEIFPSASPEGCGTPWPVVVHSREIVRKLPQRVLDNAWVVFRVGSETDTPTVLPPGPGQDHVAQ